MVIMIIYSECQFTLWVFRKFGLRNFGNKVIVIKYGGHALPKDGSFDPCLELIASEFKKGEKIVLVHGGGPQINEELEIVAQVDELTEDGIVVNLDETALDLMSSLDLIGLSEEHDRSHGSAYDRGSADAWYHRPKNPHKMVGNQKVKLTDPADLKAYYAGYEKTAEEEGPWGGKRYDESVSESAGVGVIASKKQAQDPRYSTSLTVDVQPGQDQKELAKYNQGRRRAGVLDPSGKIVEYKPAKSAVNFTPDDIKSLENIGNLEAMKDAAFELISKPSERPMKPEKVAWFRQALDSKKNTDSVLKLMWDLYLSGSEQGLSVIGSRDSMKPSRYRQSFGEQENGGVLDEAEYQGRSVQLGKPKRTPGGPKKFSVYVKNEKGNVVKVNFGDPDLSIKRDNPNRRKNFRARHNCDNPGPKTKARYWSCRNW